MQLFCKRCRRVVSVGGPPPLEATCPLCRGKIRNTSRQIEDLALGTLGHHRHG